MVHNYHLIYKENQFSKELLDTIKWVGTDISKEKIMYLSKFIKKHFNIESDLKIKIDYSTQSALNEAIYLNCTKEIIFYGFPSLITVLHELRHFVQFNTNLNDIELDYDDKEIDARSWSASLYYSCFPKEYEKLYNNNKLKFR